MTTRSYPCPRSVGFSGDYRNAGHIDTGSRKIGLTRNNLVHLFGSVSHECTRYPRWAHSWGSRHITRTRNDSELVAVALVRI